MGDFPWAGIPNPHPVLTQGERRLKPHLHNLNPPSRVSRSSVRAGGLGLYSCECYSPGSPLNLWMLGRCFAQREEPKEIRLLSQKQAIICSVAMLDLGLNSQHQNFLRSQSDFSQKLSTFELPAFCTNHLLVKRWLLPPWINLWRLLNQGQLKTCRFPLAKLKFWIWQKFRFSVRSLNSSALSLFPHRRTNLPKL